MNFKGLLLAFAFVASASTAKADGLACGFKVDMTGKSIHIIFGTNSASGVGKLTCFDTDGGKTETAIKVTIKGYGVGVGFSKEKFTMLATNVALADSVENLFGKYYVVSAGILTVDIGGEVGAGLSIRNDSLALNLTLVGKTGKGKRRCP